jgi:hypothetical protein
MAARFLAMFTKLGTTETGSRALGESSTSSHWGRRQLPSSTPTQRTSTSSNTLSR